MVSEYIAPLANVITNFVKTGWQSRSLHMFYEVNGLRCHSKITTKETDRKLCKAMLEIYKRDVERSLIATLSWFKRIETYKGNVSALCDDLYNNSVLVDNVKAMEAFSGLKPMFSRIENDPMYKLAVAINRHYQWRWAPQVTYYEKQITQLQRNMQGLKDNIKDKILSMPMEPCVFRLVRWPTIRTRFGVEFGHYTIWRTCWKNATGEDGFMRRNDCLICTQKETTDNTLAKMVQLHTAFIGSQPTTAVNSGSPVLNAKVNFIGTNFDRNWEGTMSDIMYNPPFAAILF